RYEVPAVSPYLGVVPCCCRGGEHRVADLIHAHRRINTHVWRPLSAWSVLSPGNDRRECGIGVLDECFTPVGVLRDKEKLTVIVQRADLEVAMIDLDPHA